MLSTLRIENPILIATTPLTTQITYPTNKDDIHMTVRIIAETEMLPTTDMHAAIHLTITLVEIVRPPPMLFHNGEILHTIVDNSRFRKKHRKKF